MNYFLDTSAIIKIYHSEGGTGFMRGLYRDTHGFTISELASLEQVRMPMDEVAAYVERKVSMDPEA